MDVVFICAHIEQAADNAVLDAPVIGLTQQAMDDLYIQPGYDVSVSTASYTKPGTQPVVERQVTARVELDDDISRKECTLSRGASSALQTEGRPLERVRIVAVVPNATLVGEILDSQALLDDTMVDATALANSKLQLNAVFWLATLQFLFGVPDMISQALPMVVMAVLVAMIVQLLWTLRHNKYTHELPHFRRLKRHWAATFGTGSQTQVTATVEEMTPTAVLRECEAIADVRSWSMNIAMHKASTWYVLTT